MFERIKEKLIGILTSRVTVMVLIAFALAGILLYRLFQLQIVRGEEYLNNFILESRKTREIAAARGKILDRNGKVLAYNELAYSVKIEDVYETSRSKNKNLNANIRKLIKLIEKNGDSIIMDFGIAIDENGEYAFTATSDSRRLRFLADVYGQKYVTDLKLEMQTAKPDEVIENLGKNRLLLQEQVKTDPFYLTLRLVYLGVKLHRFTGKLCILLFKRFY